MSFAQTRRTVVQARALFGPGLGWMLLLLVAVVFPIVVSSQYAVAVGVTVLTYITLAISLDLVVGRLGLLSFAHPAFFGISGYVTALTAVHFGASFELTLVVAVAVSVMLSIPIGLLSFRLSLHAFAMGTLAFAQIAWVLALNWTDVTNGPLCATGVLGLSFGIGPWWWSAVTPEDYYYAGLALATVTFVVVWQIARGRIGRAWHAIRDDELLAAGAGVPVMKYKQLAFSLGAAFAGAAGAFYVAYATVACPTALAIAYSVNLIVILFLGGRGTLFGPILGAILFTAAPEVFRVADEWRLVVYGVLVLVGAVYIPEGIVGWVGEWLRARRLRSTTS